MFQILGSPFVHNITITIFITQLLECCPTQLKGISQGIGSAKVQAFLFSQRAGYVRRSGRIEHNILACPSSSGSSEQL